MKKYDIILILFIIAMIAFAIFVWQQYSYVDYGCPTDSYWEQQYNELKKAYNHDEELLKYWTKIDDNTRVLK